MNDDTRPKWPHDIDQDLFTWLLRSIVQIDHRWKMTSPDRSKDWIAAIDKDDNEQELPTDFFQTNKFFSFKPKHNSLIDLTYEGQRARDDLDKIRKWDGEHAKELAEYARFKAKFGDV